MEYLVDRFGVVRFLFWEDKHVITKKDIARRIAEEVGLPQLKIKEIVQKTFDTIIEALVREGRIELRNFGVFEVKLRAARKARNPRTGEKVYVPKKWVVTFKPGKEMQHRIRHRERVSQRVSSPSHRGAATEPIGTPSQ